MPNQVFLNPDGSIDSTIHDIIGTWEIATVVSGAITIENTGVLVGVELPAFSADLDTVIVTDVTPGRALFLRVVNSSTSITLKHAVGNLYLPGGDLTLNSLDQIAMFVWSGSVWTLIGPTASGDDDCGCSNGAVTQPPISNTDLAKLCAGTVAVVDYLIAATEALLVAVDPLKNSTTNIVPVNSTVVQALIDEARTLTPRVATIGQFTALANEINGTAITTLISQIQASTFRSAIFCQLVCLVKAARGYNEAVFTTWLATITTPAVADVMVIVSRDIIGYQETARRFAVASIDTSSDCDACTCEGEWCYTFDYSVGALTFTPNLICGDNFGQYSSGAWRSVGGLKNPSLGCASEPFWRVLMGTVAIGAFVTSIEMTYDFTPGGGFKDAGLYVGATALANGDVTAGTDKTVSWSGGLDIATLTISLWASEATTAGSSALKKLVLRGTGVNPFGADNCDD